MQSSIDYLGIELIEFILEACMRVVQPNLNQRLGDGSEGEQGDGSG